jgi:hypothetical protein
VDSVQPSTEDSDPPLDTSFSTAEADGDEGDEDGFNAATKRGHDREEELPLTPASVDGALGDGLVDDQRVEANYPP